VREGAVAVKPEHERGVVRQRDQLHRLRPRVGLEPRLGYGHIVAADIEVPNRLVNLV
jgi:hypothetical protein